MINLPLRRRLPDERQSIVHKFRVGAQEGYLIVGLYDDGSPGELFVFVSKQGSTVSGLMDALAALTSMALQYGVPLTYLTGKMRGILFEPDGLTDTPQVPHAASLVDYVFAWMEQRFGGLSVKR